ncbi:hypothetical protein M3Y94_00407600 [Aphelenchoides besseyi]|nr:hypothetical protein M3Y94_00407600 [Aphelenchoides besseyi]
MTSKKPTVSEVWASHGRMEDETVTRADYPAHDVKEAERYQIQHQTRETTDVLRGDGKIDSKTVHQADYTAKVGERYPVKKKLHDSNALKGVGEFETHSSTAIDYQPITHGERYDTQRPKSSEIWKKSGKIEDASVTRADYTAKEGLRYETHKPVDSNVLKGQGKFAAQTSTAIDYTPKQGDRYEVKRPESDADLWKRDGKITDSTVNRSDYGAVTQGDRYERQVPQSTATDIIQPGGRFSDDLRERSEVSATIGDRYETVRPSTSDIWKTSGAMDAQSATHLDYVPHRTDQRPVVQRPIDSNVLKSDGQFESETTASSAYRPGQAVRFDIPRRAEASDIWKTKDATGEFGKSVTRTDYEAAANQSEFGRDIDHVGIVPRFEESTDLWKSNQPMETQTISQTSYTTKHVDRVKAVGRQHKSELTIGSDAEHQMGEYQTVNQHDYLPHSDVHRQALVRPHGEIQLSREGTLDGQSAYKESYQAPTIASRSKAVRPSTALRLSGEHEIQSGYQQEFVNVPDQPHHCIAGELVEGVRHHHRKTPHFKLHDVHQGHHFFEPRTGESSSSSTRTTNTADSDATLT